MKISFFPQGLHALIALAAAHVMFVPVVFSQGDIPTFRQPQSPGLPAPPGLGTWPTLGAWSEPTELKLNQFRTGEESFTNPMQAIHAVHLYPFTISAGVKRPKILFVDWLSFGRFSDGPETTPRVVLFDPQTGDIHNAPNGNDHGIDHNLFCGGHAMDKDGRLFWSGGGHGECDPYRLDEVEHRTSVFDPTAWTWSTLLVNQTSGWYQGPDEIWDYCPQQGCNPNPQSWQKSRQALVSDLHNAQGRTDSGDGWVLSRFCRFSMAAMFQTRYA